VRRDRRVVLPEPGRKTRCKWGEVGRRRMRLAIHALEVVSLALTDRPSDVFEDLAHNS
jgi:hypothetical protein